jgi:uncharacterized protein YndB with AHSA1/START domain
MAHPFEIKDEQIIEATPEQVWQALTDGPHIDSWFMGRTHVEPRQGGAVRTDFGDFVMESTVVVWQPLKRFVHRTSEAEDGRLMSFEYLIEGRAGGKTVLRFVHSGFLAEGWESEYESLKKGDPLYLYNLAQYLTYFAGQTARRNIFTFGAHVADKEHFWTVLYGKLGLSGRVAVGEPVQATLDGLPPLVGVVDFVNPDFLGVRTTDGLYRFIHGDGTGMVGHHLFGDPVDERHTDAAWQTWMAESFSAVAASS